MASAYLRDLLNGADLAGTYDLVLVQQEHRHTGRIYELVDLRTSGAQPSGGVLVGRDLADAVGLVADEYVEAILASLHEVVEVLEQVRRPMVSILPPAARVGGSGAPAEAVRQVLRELTDPDHPGLARPDDSVPEDPWRPKSPGHHIESERSPVNPHNGTV
ncbi:hypothetical protein GCM10009780_04070 [Actinomadura alba]